VWIHICASSSITLFYAAIFKSRKVCELTGVPYFPPSSSKGDKNEWQELAEWWRNRQNQKKGISPANIRQQDRREFESAGRKRPEIKK